MRIRFCAVTCAAFAFIACDERRSPVAPVPHSGTPVSAPVGEATGVVRDSHGNPIEGAAISFWPDVGKQFSNAAGQFAIPNVYVEMVSASKPGYESAFDWVPNAGLTLHDIIRIPAGQSARVTVGSADSLDWDLTYRVRTIRVFSNGHRVVRIQVQADDNGPVDYRVFDPCCAPNPSTFFIEGGGERLVGIRVPANSTVSRTFTIITSAEDP